MSSVGLMIACRMGSQRLPGKTLAPVAGRPLLHYVLERCRPLSARGVELVIATTTFPQDDEIAAFGASEGIAVFRGSADDVAGRLLGCAAEWGFDHWYRVNGDSPFLSSDLMKEALRLCTPEVDLVTNLLPRCFPYGVSVELVRNVALEREYPGLDREDREHPTGCFYRHPERFTIRSIRQEIDQSSVRLTVDTEEDLGRFRGFVETHRSVNWSEIPLDEIVRFYSDRSI